MRVIDRSPLNSTFCFKQRWTISSFAEVKDGRKRGRGGGVGRRGEGVPQRRHHHPLRQRRRSRVTPERRRYFSCLRQNELFISSSSSSSSPSDFPANEIVKFLLGFSNKGPENFVVESLDASFRYPQDYQFYIQNFTALQLGIEVPASRQATFEYSFIPAEPMGGRPFGLVINLNYKDANGNIFQDAVFNQTV
uniref:Translocon-associated protein subunit alpha n=1 Tax=Gasterosteus aculeatus aculeatus TaxID=481459 RepID=A0AAQ4S956_GASAC